MSIVKLVRDGMPNLLPMKRTPGMHVSAIINDLCLTLGHYKDSGEEVNQARLELGNAVEHALRDRLELDDPDSYMQPGELELDGVTGTPDLLQPVLRADHEVKATYMSSKHGPGSQKFLKYEWQLKSYLKMLSTPASPWLLGFLHVFYINGDYTYGPGSGPIYRIWRYEFTGAELDANWRMLMQHAERMAR